MSSSVVNPHTHHKTVLPRLPGCPPQMYPPGRPPVFIIDVIPFGFQYRILDSLWRLRIHRIALFPKGPPRNRRRWIRRFPNTCILYCTTLRSYWQAKPHHPWAACRFCGPQYPGPFLCPTRKNVSFSFSCSFFRHSCIPACNLSRSYGIIQSIILGNSESRQSQSFGRQEERI